MKTCPTCDRTLPLDAFGINRAYRDGRNYYCRECRNADRRARYVATPKSRKYASNQERWRASYWRHREQRLAEQRAYRAANREVLAEKARARYLENREQRLAYARAYAAANREAINARHRAAHAASRERDRGEPESEPPVA